MRGAVESGMEAAEAVAAVSKVSGEQSAVPQRGPDAHASGTVGGQAAGRPPIEGSAPSAPPLGGPRDGPRAQAGEQLDEEAFELERVDILCSHNLLDTPPEEPVDAYAHIAARAFGAPIACISLVDGEREWFKGSVGMSGVPEVYLNHSIGKHVVQQGQDKIEPLVVPDLSKDARFSESLLVTGEIGARFYAGAPLIVTRDERKYCIGVLAVIDPNPREGFDEKEVALLQVLATSCVREIETMPLRQDGAMAPLTKDGTDRRVQELKIFIPFSRRKVDDGCIRMIAQKLKPRIVHTGQYITRVGNPGDTLFFLASGSCSCVLNGVELERLRKGQCFGEVALLNMCKIRAMGVKMEEARERCRRNANVVALERCELLEFCFEEAWPLLKKAPNLWYTLQDMAKRRAQCVNRLSTYATKHT